MWCSVLTTSEQFRSPGITHVRVQHGNVGGPDARTFLTRECHHGSSSSLCNDRDDSHLYRAMGIALRANLNKMCDRSRMAVHCRRNNERQVSDLAMIALWIRQQVLCRSRATHEGFMVGRVHLDPISDVIFVEPPCPRPTQFCRCLFPPQVRQRLWLPSSVLALKVRRDAPLSRRGPEHYSMKNGM